MTEDNQQLDVSKPLQEFIGEELLSGQVVDLEDNLLADGMIDSIGVMRLVAFIDERFNYRVPPEHITIDYFRTVTRLAGYLGSRIDGSN